MAPSPELPATVYLDHGATSWPKPPEVAEALSRAVTEFGGNPGRGAYRLAVETSRALHTARTEIARFVGVADSKNLLFQPGCTQAMNLVLYGLLSPGDRVVVCSMEHNAVARPLNVLAQRGVRVVIVDADEVGVVDPDAVDAAVRAEPTQAVVCQHAGNVSGAVQPVADLSDIAHEHGALMLVDGAQAGGHLDVDLGALGVDAWACSGHKGLLGPQGIGLLYLAPTCEPSELVAGGTGAGGSEEPMQPRVRPDRYEAGTPNTPGIVGLHAAVRWLRVHGAQLRVEEARLIRRLHEGVLDLGGFRVLGPGPGEPRVPIIAVTHDSVHADKFAFALDRRFGIATRAGLHCAPWAHRTMGTLDTGALRLGVGFGTTDENVEVAIEALRTLAKELA
ncbi:MAG: aminotransferase class V-fold PLP-dependent enzyme [Coriobacteriia bacterium]|nr:aminotransferase class V-fold PLP-dependent enzyme [Coriobacteriia bacterium]